MYDAVKIIPGLVVFLALVTFPMWFHAAKGKVSVPPDPKIITEKKQCVAPTEYMKANHMDLLNQWRDKVVREKIRVHDAFNGEKYNMSLTKTCLDCHSNKAEFCDRCHDYAGVTPYCWDCHIDPEEVK